MKITIIGAGLGGLTFGALAARDGHEVEIFDKNSRPGGVVALLEHEGYKFEQGPLLIGDMLPGEGIYELLKSLGITSCLILCGAPILVGVLVYVVAAVKIKVVTREDCLLLPKGAKIAKLLHL